MNIAQFNYLESGLWFLMAVVLLIAAFKQGFSGPYFKVFGVSCLSFLVFGVSDLIEAKTGAWWRPFWLLAMKAVCIGVFIVCYLWYQKIKRKVLYERR